MSGPDNPQAFPCLDNRHGCLVLREPGMSLRDWFAGQALSGILSGPCSRPMVPMSEWLDAPQQAYRIADAMLAARKTGEQP
jgi:hypothetical protein